MITYLLFTSKKALRSTFECNSDLCVPLSTYGDPSYKKIDIVERILIRLNKN